MAATKANQKVIEKEVDGLITCVTGFSPLEEADQENFELCRRYVLSNIYYHRFLDTNSHDVRRQLQGLATKLRVHMLPDRADLLERLWQQLVQREEWRDNAQWDIEWRLLSLLVNLSRRPTSLDAVGASAGVRHRPAASAQTAAGVEIDWVRELVQPEPAPSPYESPEEWSDLEEDEEEDGGNAAAPGHPDPAHWPMEGADDTASRLVLPWAPPPSAEEEEEEEDPHTWLEEHTAHSYEPSQQTIGPLRPQPDGAETFHACQQRLGLAAGQRVTKVAEWLVCRELVWQLLSAAESPLLQLQGDRLTSSGRYRVQGLTQVAFSGLMDRMCVVVNALRRLRTFARQPGLRSPATHRAFAASLTSHLAPLDAELVTLERQLIQEVETVTLLAVQARLSDWFSHLEELDSLYQRGVLDVDENRPGWVRAARLVSVLYASVETCCDQRWSASLLQLFLDTLQPLLAIVNDWTVSETDPASAHDFLIERNGDIAVTDAQYWSKSFIVHDDFFEWWADDVEPLPFLLPHLDRVVQTAKCLRMLCHLNMTAQLDDSNLVDEFNRLVGEALSRGDPTAASQSASPAAVDAARASPPPTDDTPSEDSGRCSEAEHEPSRLREQLQHLCRSPYLTAAFADVLESRKGAVHQPAEAPRCLPAVGLSTSVPHVVCSALGSATSARLAAVGGRVVAALRDDLRLLEHLRMLRRVFLLEAGDLMAEFTQQLFKTLATDTAADESVTLTLALEDVISTRYPEMAAQFAVTVVQPDAGASLPERLEAVTLGYKVPWPGTIVITADSLVMYNQMFRFILRLKFTLRALQVLSFKDLAAGGTAADVSGGSAASLALDEAPGSSPTSHILRLQLLRAWLLHFVGNIHSYIMMVVLHSTWLELESRLDKADNIDSIVEVHTAYVTSLHRRCLLAGSAERHLRSAVLAGLQVALRLVAAWPSGAGLAEPQLAALEADCSRCHRFVVGLLRQYRQTVSHVEYLTAAMAHSVPCPVQSTDLS